ncbi:MAG: hypothetical protein JSV88_21985 [Candidatus Aminicenantes bacterium]|nr:MAG: hypothetical protein JSV88_21985 [Candidatus Aminicenantes bacterium]
MRKIKICWLIVMLSVMASVTSAAAKNLMKNSRLSMEFLLRLLGEYVSMLNISII